MMDFSWFNNRERFSDWYWSRGWSRSSSDWLRSNNYRCRTFSDNWNIANTFHLKDSSKDLRDRTSWKLEEMSLGWLTLLDNLPFLLKSNLVNNSFSLLKVDNSNDWDLSIMELRNMDALFICWRNLLDHSVSQDRDTNIMFSGDSVLRNFDVFQDWQINNMFDSLSFKSVHFLFHWEDKLTSLDLSDFEVVHLRKRDWVLFGWESLLDVQEMNLRDVNRTLKGWNDLFDEDKLHLRDVNWLLDSWDDDVDLDVVDLREIDCILRGFWVW